MRPDEDLLQAWVRFCNQEGAFRDCQIFIEIRDRWLFQSILRTGHEDMELLAISERFYKGTTHYICKPNYEAVVLKISSLYHSATTCSWSNSNQLRYGVGGYLPKLLQRSHVRFIRIFIRVIDFSRSFLQGYDKLFTEDHSFSGPVFAYDINRSLIW